MRVNSAVEVKHLTPPLLEDNNFMKKVVCYRPLRKEQPMLQARLIDNKIIADCYGHGGSGWTLGPGSAAYVRGLIIKELSRLTFDKQENIPVTIIGAGAIGLLTALDLATNGFKNIQVVAKDFQNLASHNAGGLFAAMSMANRKEYTSEILQQLKGFSEIGYNFFKEIAQKRHPHLKKGASLMPLYIEPAYDPLKLFVDKGIIKPPTPVEVVFANNFRRKLLTHDNAIYMDTPLLMIELRQCLEGFGVKFIQREIQKIENVDSQIVVNCTGLGARKLVNDLKVTPVQGHVILLKNQKPQELQYLIAVERGNLTNSKGQINPIAFYYMPKRLPDSSDDCMGVIGGSFIEGASQDDENLDQFDFLKERAREFYGYSPTPQLSKL